MPIKSFSNLSTYGKLLLLLVAGAHSSCEKLVSTGAPINTITTAEVFSTNEQAKAAMATVYSGMVNDNNGTGSALASFSTGLTTVLGALSADELNLFINQADPLYLYNTNRLTVEDPYSKIIWTTAYQAIYGANAVIEGIAASRSGKLQDTVRKELTGEAKFIRAFCYFYLTNLYGAVPLVLTVDFNTTRNLPRAPQVEVYRQIIKDLEDARSMLPPDHSAGKGERIIPNTWAATALLARVYLYTGDYVHAAERASAIIANGSIYSLEADVNKVFLKESKEPIWQLKQNTSVYMTGNATPEGAYFVPDRDPNGDLLYLKHNLSNELLDAFEPGDLRRAAWVDSAENPINVSGVYYYPMKYKTGNYNKIPGGEATEYYMCLRFAEQYLIRAEAAAHGAGGGSAAAIADLNMIRRRAGLSDLPGTLTPAELPAAIAHERQIEFFAEWGHRWLDLKRTGEAHAVLSQNPVKQPWRGDYQLLYPIPTTEIQADHFLIQNPGY